MFLLWKYLSRDKLPQHNRYYYQIVDEKDNISYVHDLGHSPKDSGTIQSIQILKKEYNNRKENIIKYPTYIKIGRHPKNLNIHLKINPKDIEENEMYYNIHFELPKIP